MSESHVRHAGAGPRLSQLPGALEARYGIVGDAVPEPDRKHASVALVLRVPPGSGADPPARESDILVIKRALHERDPWSGHMALPGGRVQAEDGDLVATAVRETLEETGLDLRAGSRTLGRVETMKPVGGGLPPLTIWPFVFRVGPEAWARVNSPHEVEQIHWFPVGELMAPANRSTYHLERGGSRLAFPAIRIEGRVIWGLTYRILEGFFTLFEAEGPGRLDRAP